MRQNRAHFVMDGGSVGTDIKALQHNLEYQYQPSGEPYDVVNNGQPLDTLWRNLSPIAIRVQSDDRPVHVTVPLIRDTKHINISLRELDKPAEMDINDYDLTITDRNSRLLWNNSVPEGLDQLRYTPYNTWNTEDKAPDGNNIIGRIGHADFMTSRLVFHDKSDDDARLRVVYKPNGKEVVNINLVDMLARLRITDERTYPAQEFLDRGYDYRITFYLRGGELQYADISISVLSWTRRIQFVDLK